MKTCSHCKRGEINNPADIFVTGRNAEDRPYRAWICLSHYHYESMAGANLETMRFCSDAGRNHFAEILWGRYEAAKPAVPVNRSNLPEWNRALRIHSQWLEVSK